VGPFVPTYLLATPVDALHTRLAIRIAATLIVMTAVPTLPILTVVTWAALVVTTTGGPMVSSLTSPVSACPGTSW